jgi:nucleoid-associated protein YgaU
VKGVDRATHSHASGKRSVIRVRKGDSLWRLARRHFGHGRQWKKFYNANRKKLENPDLIYPGQRLVLPG